MSRLLALLATVVICVPSMAQSGDAGAPAQGSGGADWSEFGLASAERGAGAICASGGCSAADTRGGALGLKTRAGLEARPNLVQERQSGGLIDRAASPSPALEWRQHLGIRDGEEAYNCILSLGIGGELKSNGYVGSQLFGRATTLKRGGGTDAK
jgi:hypothetical protein